MYSSIKKKKAPSRAELLSPLDTYEISDNEDTDDELDDEERRKKRIPGWARHNRLVEAIEYQFSVGRKVIDPDEIFGEVRTCDLETVFEQSKDRYKQRTSSGCWTNDRVTEEEKLAYKQAYAADY